MIHVVVIAGIDWIVIHHGQAIWERNIMMVHHVIS